MKWGWNSFDYIEFQVVGGFGSNSRIETVRKTRKRIHILAANKNIRPACLLGTSRFIQSVSF